jgi:phage gpG-like protein
VKHVTKGAKVERWERKLEAPTQALHQIGLLMVAESQQSFRAQAFGGLTWPQRRVPNVFGIIADFAAGKKQPPRRRFDARPALQDTGRLASSIAHRVVGKDVVEVGSNLPYAGTMHHGGKTESARITDAVAELLADWLRQDGAPWRKALGWILNRKFRGKTLKGRVPARPFVGITEQTIEDVREVVAVKIMEAK